MDNILMIDQCNNVKCKCIIFVYNAVCGLQNCSNSFTRYKLPNKFIWKERLDFFWKIKRSFSQGKITLHTQYPLYSTDQ